MRQHEFELDVRWGDMDALGHVNNVVYLTYFESARVDLIRGLGLSRKDGVAAVVAQANISYKLSAKYPAKLKVVTTISRFGNTSMTYHHSLQERDGSKIYCEAEVVVVWVGLESNQPASVPESVKRWAAES